MTPRTLRFLLTLMNMRCCSTVTIFFFLLSDQAYNTKLAAELGPLENEALQIVALKRHIKTLATERKRFELSSVAAKGNLFRRKWGNMGEEKIAAVAFSSRPGNLGR